MTDIAASCRDIARELAQAEAAIAGAQPVALNDLDARLSALLAAAQELPKPQRHALVPALEELHAAFGRLETLMRGAVAAIRAR